MDRKRILKLHWKLFFPLVGVLWLIIGITIYYFVSHEQHRQRVNLENRLLNVNNTVIDAYEKGADMQKTVDFIRLFTDNTTLSPLRITVFDSNGKMVADNPATTIHVYDSVGNVNPLFRSLVNYDNPRELQDAIIDVDKSMVSAMKSSDGQISSFAALPYQGKVMDFLSIDPMVWIVVIFLGLLSSGLAFWGVRVVCQNVYALRDFAKAVSEDNLTDAIDSWRFTKDELGEVSKNLLMIYRDKIAARQEKLNHERQVGINISHELNTPVGIIKGYLDTALDTEDMQPELREKFLRRAQESADRLSEIIKDVTLVMRLENNSEKIAGETIDMHQVVQNLADDDFTSAMTYDYDVPEHCRINGSESLVVTALRNLMKNAAQHSKGSVMTLRCDGLTDGYYHFTFADDGIGVGREHIDRLFDLFYRVDSGRARKNGGAGVGLPLVRRIIESMGGVIDVSSPESGGLVFHFTLPSADK